jgi:hypothetical protein
VKRAFREIYALIKLTSELRSATELTLAEVRWPREGGSSEIRILVEAARAGQERFFRFRVTPMDHKHFIRGSMLPVRNRHRRSGVRLQLAGSYRASKPCKCPRRIACVSNGAPPSMFRKSVRSVSSSAALRNAPTLLAQRSTRPALPTSSPSSMSFESRSETAFSIRLSLSSCMFRSISRSILVSQLERIP